MTFGASDLSAFERAYVEFLGYLVRDRSSASPALLRSWGIEADDALPMLTLSSPGADDVLLRVVEAPHSPQYRALSSFGWTACEIIVDDVWALADRLRHSPFRIIGEPKPLQFMPSIVAMQVVGPAEECLYLTMEGGDRATSLLPRPRSTVDRPFILVIAGPRFDELVSWWRDTFALIPRPVRAAKVGVVQRALGLQDHDTIALTTLRLAENGFMLELDGYPATAGRRTTPKGAFPRGNAIGTFDLDDIDRVASIAIRPPEPRPEFGYDDRRACTVVGPAGELAEFVETG